jgi:hypothetical protein
MANWTSGLAAPLAQRKLVLRYSGIARREVHFPTRKKKRFADENFLQINFPSSVT